jgi:hypothetical protein
MWNDKLDAQEIKRQIDDFHNHHIGGFFIHAMPTEFRPDDFPGGMPGYLSDNFFKMVKIAVEHAAKLGMQVWLYDEGGWPSGTLNGKMLSEYPKLILHSILPNGEIIPYNDRPDLFNPETTAIFIKETHEKYAYHLKEYFGTVIPGIFTDEPFFGKFIPDKMLPWSPILAKRFYEIKGYDAKDAAMKILTQADKEAQKDYCQVISTLIVENFLRPIAQWCHKNNLLSTGHFNGDDSLKNVRELLGGDIYYLHDNLDICGCDAIWRQIHPLMPETDFSRMASSAAKNKLSISETFAVYGNDLSLAEMKQIAAMQFVAGINIIAPMAVHYSCRKSRQITTIANFYGADPRWENFTQLSDFLNRMSHLFDRTTPIIKASIQFPKNELQNGSPYPDIFAKGLQLASRQITYDYQIDAKETLDNILCDIKLCEPCPALRTRHLRSPRGERLILVNSSLSPISFRFIAPEGYSAWYDPATGKRTRAYANKEGIISVTLPFGGVLALLTIPGKKQIIVLPKTTYPPKIALDFKKKEVLKMIKATENGLVEIPVPKEIPKKFCGTVRYEAIVDIPTACSAKVFLPHALRQMIKLTVNKKTYDTKVWMPYEWNVNLVAGKNILFLDISNTPENAINTAEYTNYLKEKGYFNSYIEITQKFEPLFPNENPISQAFLKIGE